MKLRNEVKWFAEKMEIELQANDHKGGWRDCYLNELLAGVHKEYKELLSAVMDGNIERIISEAADVANFALMVADVTYRYGVRTFEAAQQITEADGLDSEPKCMCPADGVWPGCPIHGNRRR